jgi:ribosome-associated protein
LEGIDIARRAVDAASDKQAVNIVLLDVRELCGFADYFVICSGESLPQLNAIRDEIEKNLKAGGEVPVHTEGSSDSGWVLLDFGDVIIHVFGENEREFYDLEGFWRNAKTVLNVQ